MRKQIEVADLEVGMYVEELDRPWLGTPFLLEGVFIKDEWDLEKLRRYCTFVYVSDEIPDTISPEDRAKVAAKQDKKPEPPKKDSGERKNFEQSVAEARVLHRKARSLVDEMHEDVRLGKSVDTKVARQVVNEMVDNVVKNPDAMLWLTHLKNRDEYTAIHSMNVSILALAFGQHLGLSKDELRELGLGSLLHDIGKIKIPLEVLNKPGKLEVEEFEIMQQHPLLGYQLLKDSPELSNEVLQIVYSHHERVNGEGYPRRLPAEDITYFAKIAAVADVYDALTSDRVYRKGMAAPEAMKLMYSWRGRDFETRMIEQFIHCLGIFPSGSLVELDKGEVGFVISVNREKRLKPKVLLVLDENKKPYHPLRIIDLALFEKSVSKRDVKEVLSPGSHGISVADYAQEMASAR